MNVRYKTSAATSSIHLSFIHSSSFVRRTSDYTSFNLIHYTLFLICLFYSNSLCPAFNKVPSNHSLPSLSKSLSSSFHFKFPFNNSDTSLLNFLNRTNRTSFNKHDQFNEQNNTKKFKIISSSFSSSPAHSSLDNLKVSNLEDNLRRRLRRIKKENDYLILDRNDLFDDKKHIFLNLTRIKLKRDQRNLERKNESSINLIRLNYFNHHNLTALNNSELYQSYLQDSIEANQHLNELKEDNLPANEKEGQQPSSSRNSLTMLVSMSILYIVIFFTGVFGNLGTCIVILRNKYMRTATNYYLFSLACSDLLLLVLGNIYLHHI